MIDTGRIEIRGINGVNSAFYRQLVRWSSETVTYEGSGARGMVQRELIINPKKGGWREKFRMNIKKASSDYKTTIIASPLDDRAIIEWSFPKYYFGNNILQICDSPLDKKFSYGRGVTDTLEYQFKSAYEKFMIHLENFFHTEFAGVKMDWAWVMVKRIDLCYNQIFRSKEDAIHFLEEQKKYTMKNVKQAKDYNFKESIFIVSKNYSFKIYHKGPEFKKNDSREMLKNSTGRQNKAMRKEVIERMQGIADRILRYELSFRNSQLSYLYNSKIFRKDSKDFNAKKTVYNKLKYINEKTGLAPDLMHDKESLFYKKVMYFNGRILPSRKWTFLEYLCRKYHRKFSSPPTLIQMGRYYRKFFVEMDKMFNSQRDFIFKLNKLDEMDHNDDAFTDRLDNKTYKQKLFTPELINECSKQFIDLIKQFQPKRMDSSYSMQKLLEEHNLNVGMKKKNYRAINMTAEETHYMSPNFYKAIFLLMEKHSLRTIKKLLSIPKTTYWRIKKNMLILGIDQDTILEPLIIDTDISYNRYYTIVQENNFTFASMLPIKKLW